MNNLKEFMEMVNRVRELLIKEEMVKSDITNDEMCKVLEDTAESLGFRDLSSGEALKFSMLIVFIDYFYSIGGYSPYNKPHITLEWVIAEAYEIYAYAKKQKDAL